MPDRRQNEEPATPDQIAEVRLSGMKFREGDPEKEILLAMAKQINEKHGRALEPQEKAAGKESAADQPAATTAAESEQKRELSPEQAEKTIKTLETRFQAEENKKLCPKLSWDKAEKALRVTPEALWSVDQMEQNGHEPGIYFSDKTGFEIGTLAKEAPSSTRNCVYDKRAEEWLKINSPQERFNGNAVDQARAMGIELKTIEQDKHIAGNTPAYNEQSWRWYKTQDNIRDSGYALTGFRVGSALSVYQCYADVHNADGGWGGSLRVNFVN